MKKYLLRLAMALAAILIIPITGNAQDKNFIDQPYLETNSRVDTLVVPDRIYLGIVLQESDSKGRTSVEKLENKMAAELQKIGIDLQDQLMLADLSSNFKDYFLRSTDVQKSKAFTLVVYDAQMAGKAIKALEGAGISNISFRGAEVSNLDELKVSMRSKAVLKAKEQAQAMVEPLGQSVGKALYISDLSTEYTPYQDRGPRVMMEMAKSDNAEPIDVPFNKVNVQAMVNVKFMIQ
ncbi:SIMPL domain-containing protein [Zeaxanthinibacter sp. PT1]|uniref:SIMPL domain-containing protein n=1 Tax=Zeaxanthinibacter TaxID=561554 RepID=UPI00234A2392|nr:SIMPL domain-containing protein [Zeaxanthinibacter sp. PT1]MDC6350887.1 SIMPL domain-containing protein [Zeaxanthinibacter sp. PT1]